jgi:hypothetical protein
LNQSRRSVSKDINCIIAPKGLINLIVTIAIINYNTFKDYNASRLGVRRVGATGLRLVHFQQNGSAESHKGDTSQDDQTDPPTTPKAKGQATHQRQEKLNAFAHFSDKSSGEIRSNQWMRGTYCNIYIVFLACGGDYTHFRYFLPLMLIMVAVPLTSPLL